MDEPYASAIIDFLDRDSQTHNRVMAYPITRIELHSRMSNVNPRGHPIRVFTVDPNGVWSETVVVHEDEPS